MTKRKQRSELVLNDSAIVGSVNCSVEGAASYMLVAVSIHFYMLRLIRFALYRPLALATSFIIRNTNVFVVLTRSHVVCTVHGFSLSGGI